MSSFSQISQFELIASISQRLKSRYVKSEVLWEGSPFQWLRSQPSRRKGMIAEILVEEWAEANGLTVQRSSDSDADRVISGTRVEIKSSLLWEGGSYKFQQIRDQDYSIVLCLGLSPHDAHCWAIPKGVILIAWKERYPGIGSQHGGESGTDTAWLSVNPSMTPEWLSPFGGSLQQGLSSLRSILDG